jgi:hypothetical protein
MSTAPITLLVHTYCHPHHAHHTDYQCDPCGTVHVHGTEPTALIVYEIAWVGVVVYNVVVWAALDCE